MLCDENSDYFEFWTVSLLLMNLNSLIFFPSTEWPCLEILTWRAKRTWDYISLVTSATIQLHYFTSRWKEGEEDMFTVGWGSRLYSFRVTPTLGDNYTAYCLSQSENGATYGVSSYIFWCLISMIALPRYVLFYSCLKYNLCVMVIVLMLAQCEVVDCIVVG